jgi:glyoxylase-like metal-dependent hydrolase (beta-lactamase superfamily II)
VQEIAPGIETIDTLLGGWEEVTAVYLVRGGEAAAVVDTGARTSAPALRAALAETGVGPDDLRWIVLTHVHLDHCGATGILAHAFPRAQVVVHRRGARHLIDPARLLAGSAAVYRERWSLYGGLDRTGPERVEAVEDGHRVDLGGGRWLRMVETPGHARHHMSVVDEVTGTVFAGDALGVRFPRAGLYPALPPPDVDPAAGDRSLAALAALAPALLCLAHFGPVDDPAAAIAEARRQLALCAESAAGAADRDAVARALEQRLPFAASVGDEAAVARWRRLGWGEATIDGLLAWGAAAAG